MDPVAASISPMRSAICAMVSTACPFTTRLHACNLALASSVALEVCRRYATALDERSSETRRWLWRPTSRIGGGDPVWPEFSGITCCRNVSSSDVNASVLAALRDERPISASVSRETDNPQRVDFCQSGFEFGFGIVDAGSASDGFWNRYGPTPFQSRFTHALVTGRR